MRVLRGIGAVLLMVVGLLLSVVAIVLCVTIILLPLGIPLALLAVKLWRYAFTLMLPRQADVRRGLRKGFHVREMQDAASTARKEASRHGTRLRKKARKVRKKLPG
ncbi:hypothetical protein ACFQ34_04840 [Pseudonocardia benzenivorans]|uniref:Transmembrane protein PGPGW n=1 Tax=Pseudonocardia benzenivorans TaxID=228005 RepID=A0ABW3VBA8_9PSEU|nr:hypothetical protein PSD17_30010 [Pseudonocardia sp. D17]